MSEYNNPFETWLAEQADDVRGLVESQLTEFQAALESERSSRREIEHQVDALRTSSAVQEEREAFYEMAASEGVSNLKLAYLASLESGLLEQGLGGVMGALRKRHPELFPNASRARVGAGAGDPSPSPIDMNRWIRRASGRG